MTDYRDIADRLGVAVDALEAAAAGSRPGVAFLLIKTAHMQASAAAAGISCLPGVRWAAEVRGREGSCYRRGAARRRNRSNRQVWIYEVGAKYSAFCLGSMTIVKLNGFKGD